MKAGARMSVLLAVVGACGASGSAFGFVGLSQRLCAAAMDRELAQKSEQPTGQGLLSHPGSYVIVHRSAAPTKTDESQSEDVQIKGAIEVPANARAGDPAYMTGNEDDEGNWYWEDGSGTVFGPYGTAFADGVDLGYSALRRHGLPHGHVEHHGHGGGHNEAEFGANDLHRSAELEFSRVAQPHLATQEEGFRRAQLQFHRATLTPGVARQSDGLRHEQAPASAGRAPRR